LPMNWQDLRKWMQVGAESRFIPAIKRRLVKLSSNLGYQIAAGFLTFVASGMLVWTFTEDPYLNTPPEKKPITRKQTEKLSPSPNPSQSVAPSKPIKIDRGSGAFRVLSTPPGAEIILDGKPVGQTPYLIEKIPAGLHRLKVEKRYYIPISDGITVIKDIVTKREYSLKDGEGRITVMSSPSDATVILDGKTIKEKTPTTLGFIKAGKHKLELASAPCATGSLELDLTHNQTVQVDLILDGIDNTKYEGECLSKTQIFAREEKKRLKAEKIQEEKEEKLRIEAAAKKVEEDRHKQLRAKRLLLGIEQELAASKINSQEWLDVLAKYKEVKSLDPENRDAKRGLRKIGEQFVQLSDTAIGRADWTKAEEYLERAAELIPGLQAIVAARSRLDLSRKEEAERTPRSAFEWQDPDTGLEFVWVNGGCFEMGSDSGSSDESPLHEVCVEGFWMGRYEVTNRQYRQFKPKHDSKSVGGYSLNGDQRPVVYVSWEDVQKYASWLSQKGNGTFRLPTEAEWEYAARAGSKARYFWGESESETCKYGNVLNPSTKSEFGWSWESFLCEDDYIATAPVGQFNINRFGLYDMVGNVCEWVLDWYDEKYYSNTPRNSPTGPAQGFFRGSRGGCWNNGPANVSSADRRNYLPDYRMDYLGFRLIRQAW
jgi:formylglycine-generating enzyme